MSMCAHAKTKLWHSTCSYIHVCTCTYDTFSATYTCTCTHAAHHDNVYTIQCVFNTHVKSYFPTAGEHKPLPSLTKSRMAGYDKLFIEQPSDELICLICQMVARDPQQSKCKCGRIYCKSCVQKLKGSYSNKCPTCRRTLETFEDNLSCRRIQALMVKCDNEEAGCMWEGELGSLDRHLKVCDRQKKLQSCRYKDIGCKALFLEKDREAHERESLQVHLNLAMRCLSLETRAPPRVFKLENFAEMRRNDTFCYSPSFYSHPGGYRMCLKMFPNGVVTGHGTHFSITVELMRGENDDHLRWPFRGEVTFSVLNQISDDRHCTDTVKFDRVESAEVNSRVIEGERNEHGRGFPEFLSHKRLKQSKSDIVQYLVDDTVYVRVSSVTVSDTNKPWLTPSPVQ